MQNRPRSRAGDLMKPESKFWQVIRTNMPVRGDRLDRIENSVGDGQPDVNGCLSAEDVWIELKAPTEPKRADTPLLGCGSNHPLLQSQINWFARQAQAGGIAFVLIRTDKRVLLIDGTKYGTSQAFNRYTVAQMIRVALYHVELPMKPQDWRMLRNVIFTASRYRRLHQHAQAQQLLTDMEREQERVAGDSDARRPASVASGAVPTPRPTRRNRGAG